MAHYAKERTAKRLSNLKTRKIATSNTNRTSQETEKSPYQEGRGKIKTRSELSENKLAEFLASGVDHIRKVSIWQDIFYSDSLKYFI